MLAKPAAQSMRWIRLLAFAPNPELQLPAPQPTYRSDLKTVRTSAIDNGEFDRVYIDRLFWDVLDNRKGTDSSPQSIEMQPDSAFVAPLAKYVFHQTLMAHAALPILSDQILAIHPRKVHRDALKRFHLGAESSPRPLMQPQMPYDVAHEKDAHATSRV